MVGGHEVRDEQVQLQGDLIMICEICGKTVEAAGHICTPDVWKLIERISKLEERVKRLERLNDSMHPGWE